MVDSSHWVITARLQVVNAYAKPDLSTPIISSISSWINPGEWWSPVGAPLSASAGWELGGFYSGTRFGPNATLAYRYSDKLTASVRANYFDVRLDQGSFTTAVVRFNASYSFTPRLYVQTNVQYNDDTKDLGTNVRVGWLDTAGTGLFLVWNDTNHTGSLERTGILAGPKQRQLVGEVQSAVEFGGVGWGEVPRPWALGSGRVPSGVTGFGTRGGTDIRQRAGPTPCPVPTIRSDNGRRPPPSGFDAAKTLHLRHRKLGNHTRLLTMPLHAF